jgi:hypothetical protein
LHWCSRLGVNQRPRSYVAIDIPSGERANRSPESRV